MNYDKASNKIKSATEMLDEANRIADRLRDCSFHEYITVERASFSTLSNFMRNMVYRQLSVRGGGYLVFNLKNTWS